jgi:hypothetical protein
MKCKNTDMLMKAVKKVGGGKVQTSSDTARKLATEMGGMKHGGYAQPVKRKEGGAMKRKPQDPITRRPIGPSGRPMTDAEMRQHERDVGNMSAAEIKALGEAIGRGNRAPYEKIPKKAQGGAGKVRKGMMSPSGEILQAVKK